MSNFTLMTFLIGVLGTIISLVTLIIFVFIKREKIKLVSKVLGCFFALAVVSILIQGFSNYLKYNNSNKNKQQETMVNASDTSETKKDETIGKSNDTSEDKKEETIENSKDTSKSNKEETIEKSNDTNESTIETNSNEINVTTIKRENIIGTSNKEYKDLETSKPNTVRNDKTGNWRLSRIATNENILEYAKSYYKKNFGSDKEIHAIINFTLKTTTKVSKLDSNTLSVTVYEYKNKEEHDANKLFGGMVLADYFVYLDNGDIEQIK